MGAVAPSKCSYATRARRHASFIDAIAAASCVLSQPRPVGVGAAACRSRAACCRFAMSAEIDACIAAVTSALYCATVEQMASRFMRASELEGVDVVEQRLPIGGAERAEGVGGGAAFAVVREDRVLDGGAAAVVQVR